jgi:hypothetical protein
LVIAPRPEGCIDYLRTSVQGTVTGFRRLSGGWLVASSGD